MKLLKEIRLGSHVRVLPAKPDGSPHPHAGKTGKVTEFLGVVLTGEDWPARAMVKIDEGCERAGHTMIVTLPCLERIP
jgi:hypothetical protein